jgi:hypothetical protein
VLEQLGAADELAERLPDVEQRARDLGLLLLQRVRARQLDRACEGLEAVAVEEERGEGRSGAPRRCRCRASSG